MKGVLCFRPLIRSKPPHRKANALEASFEDLRKGRNWLQLLTFVSRAVTDRRWPDVKDREFWNTEECCKPWRAHLLSKFYFNWRMITSQFCAVFCRTSNTNQPQVCVCPLPLELPSTPSHPATSSQSTDLSSPPHTADSHWLPTLHLAPYTFQCYTLKSSHLPLPPLCRICSLSVSSLLP